MARPMPCPAPVTIATLSLSFCMQSCLLIRQRLSSTPDLRSRDRRAREIGDVELVESLSAECHVRRAAEVDGPAIPRQQGFVSGGRNAPDFVRGITADVEIAFRIERQSVGQPPTRGGINFGAAE